MGRPPRWSASGATWPGTTAGTGWRPRSAIGCAPPATTLFGVELGTYELYLPDDETLAAIAAPVRLLVSADGLPVFAEIAGRLGKRLGLDFTTTPGTHATYHEHPQELAELIRRFLGAVSAVGT